MAYGSPPKKHAERLRVDKAFIKQDLEHVRYDLRTKDCKGALIHLVELNIQLGQARAETQATGKSNKTLASQHKQAKKLSKQFEKLCVLKKK